MDKRQVGWHFLPFSSLWKQKVASRAGVRLAAKNYSAHETSVKPPLITWNLYAPFPIHSSFTLQPMYTQASLGTSMQQRKWVCVSFIPALGCRNPALFVDFPREQDLWVMTIFKENIHCTGLLGESAPTTWLLRAFNTTFSLLSVTFKLTTLF